MPTPLTAEEQSLVDKIIADLPPDLVKAATTAIRDRDVYAAVIEKQYPAAVKPPSEAMRKQNPNWASQTRPLHDWFQLLPHEKEKLKGFGEKSNETYLALQDAAKDIGEKLGVGDRKVQSNEFFTLPELAALRAVLPTSESVNENMARAAQDPAVKAAHLGGPSPSLDLSPLLKAFKFKPPV